jgi:hypothetical protein
MQLCPHKGIISDYVVGRPLLALDAPVVAVMNEQARTRREHAPGDQRDVVYPADALPATDEIGLGGLAC